MCVVRPRSVRRRVARRTTAPVDTGCTGARVECGEVRPLRWRRRSESSDVGKRRPVRRRTAAWGVRREGRRSAWSEHRRVAGHGRIVGPGAEERPASGFGRCRWGCAGVEGTRGTKPVRWRSQQAATSVHHRRREITVMAGHNSPDPALSTSLSSSRYDNKLSRRNVRFTA